MHSFKSDDFKIRVLTKDDAEEYNALLRYAFQVTGRPCRDRLEG